MVRLGWDSSLAQRCSIVYKIERSIRGMPCVAHIAVGSIRSAYANGSAPSWRLDRPRLGRNRRSVPDLVDVADVCAVMILLWRLL